MGALEKIVLVLTLILAVTAVFLLAAPDSTGRSGLQALSPLLDRAGNYGDQAADAVGSWLSDMAQSLRPPGQKVSAPSNNASQPNPFESAVGPAAGYGQTQKEIYQQPLEGLNR